ncbi:MAG: tetratricopeptide repeat protein [Xanthobacteraceae bacterium]
MDDIETAKQLFFDGLAQLEKNDFVTAERLFTEALAYAPQSVSALSNLAITKLQQKKFAACELTATRLIAANPRNIDGYDILTSSQKEQGKYAEALSSCEKMIEIDPTIAEAHCNRAFLLNALGHYREAIESTSRALAIQPAFVDAFFHRDNALRNLAHHDEALNAYDKALSIAPDSTDAWLGRASVLHELKRRDDTLAVFAKALAIKPDLADVWIGRGNVLWSLQRYGEASAAYDAALSIAPDAANAWFGRGNVLFDLKRNDGAFAAFEKALSINPDLAGAWLGRGNVCWSLHRYDEALAAFDKAISMVGQTQRDTRRDFSQPLWPGDDDISNKAILIHAEQGLGDTLMCCRYIPLVAALGARVILEVQPALVSLLRSLQGISTLIAKGETIPHFDVHCPLMSLLLGVQDDNRDNSRSYSPSVRCHGDDRTLAFQARRDGHKGRPRLGGKPAFCQRRRAIRSLENILPLLAVGGVSYFCLQKDLREGDEAMLDANPHIVRLDREVNDFADTAAIMMSLDLIFTSDTAVANLAGALGRKVWVLLPFIPDWRWSLDRDDTPWYPTATLFRQQKSGDWWTVVDRVSGELKKLSG